MPLSIWGSGPVGGGGGGGGGTSDATAANQSTQIVAADTLNTNVGTVADAQTDATVSGSLLSRVRYISATLLSVLNRLPTLVSGRIPVDGSGVTQPVSATSLPLPTGAATAANQTTSNTSLATIATESIAIDNKLPTLGTQTVANSLSVTPATGSNFAPNALTDTQLRAAPLALPVGAASETTLNSVNTALGTPADSISSSAVNASMLSRMRSILSELERQNLSRALAQGIGVNVSLGGNLVVTVTGGQFFFLTSIYIENQAASNVFLQLHNSAAGITNGDVPLCSYRIVANGALNLDESHFSRRGRLFGPANSSIRVGISSTSNFYTGVSVNNVTFQIMYYLGV